MPKDSKIGWTHHSKSLWWGCDRTSAACKFCYAADIAKHFGHDVWGRTAPRRFFNPGHLDSLLSWNRSAKKRGVRERVFINSMSDLFELHPVDEIRERMDTERREFFALAPELDHLDLLFLTKRTENIAGMVPAEWLRGTGAPRNIWLGATVEDNENARRRAPELVRFRPYFSVIWFSYEPALEWVDFTPWLPDAATPSVTVNGRDVDPRSLDSVMAALAGGPVEATGILGTKLTADWIVCGAESGPKRRPFDPAWADRVVADTRAAGAACYVKQDSHLRPGQQGRISDATWAVKEWPEVRT